MLLVQSSFHANHLTENENVIAGSAQDCYVIVWDWLTMFANNDTADTFSNEISIPAQAAQPKFPISNPRVLGQDCQDRWQGTW